jgi:ribonucleoside-diphosphate reductase alpha chain
VQGNINQTFTNKGSSGTCKSNQEAVSRLISLSLRGGIPVEKIIDQLESVDPCNSYTNARIKGKPVSKGVSCPHAIANILKQAVKDVRNKFKGINTKVMYNIELEPIEDVEDSYGCPECKDPLISEGGCIQCKSCGWSKCN